jgi:LmbE family N-acetylglucosaminyl deacetylase
MVLVAPHPDDEVFGAGGVIQHTLNERIPLALIAVTDGEASHPESKAAVQCGRPEKRHRESNEALRRSGWNDPTMARLHLPESDVRGHQEQLREKLAPSLRPDNLRVAPWQCDAHAYHDVFGRTAYENGRATGAALLYHFVRTWHWADPNGADISWDLCRRFDITRRERARKRWATGAFETQVRAIRPESADPAILPGPLLRRFWRALEIYVDEMEAIL